MKTYLISIQENLTHVVAIQADSEEEAQEIAETNLSEGTLNLTETDGDMEITAVEPLPSRYEINKSSLHTPGHKEGQYCPKCYKIGDLCSDKECANM